MVETYPVSTIKDPLESTSDLFSTEQTEQPTQPPIPIGVFKISDQIPSWIHKRPTEVPSVRSAVNKVRPSIAPKKEKRIVRYDGEEEEYEGLLFYRKKKPTWFIIPPEEKIQPLESPFVMNGARQALSTRQHQSRPVPPTQEEINTYLRKHPEVDTHLGVYEIAHDAQEIFTLAVWHWLRKELLVEEYSPEKESPSHCFREVYLNDFGVIYDRPAQNEEAKVALTCGQVDIYGTLPDNQGVIIDFGSISEYKEIQVIRQLHGTKAVIEEANHQESPPITTLIGEYFKDDEGVNIIHLRNSKRFEPQPIPDQDFRPYLARTQLQNNENNMI